MLFFHTQFTVLALVQADESPEPLGGFVIPTCSMCIL